MNKLWIVYENKEGSNPVIIGVFTNEDYARMAISSAPPNTKYQKKEFPADTLVKETL